MHRSIDYYFSLVSPWAYIGHATFMNLTQRHSLDVNFKPVSLPTVFAETGGLPLNKRAPARQRYRIDGIAALAREARCATERASEVLAVQC